MSEIRNQQGEMRIERDREWEIESESKGKQVKERDVK